jgi:hypothetical protein
VGRVVSVDACVVHLHPPYRDDPENEQQQRGS